MKALDNAGNTKIAVSQPAPAAPGASTADSFITINHDADLSAERTLKVSGPGLSLTDGGANSDVTIAQTMISAVPTIIGQVLISLNGSTFTPMLPVTDPAGGWLVDNISGLMIVV
jgi:hypothetical protein